MPRPSGQGEYISFNQNTYEMGEDTEDHFQHQSYNLGIFLCLVIEINDVRVYSMEIRALSL